MLVRLALNVTDAVAGGVEQKESIVSDHERLPHAYRMGVYYSKDREGRGIGITLLDHLQVVWQVYQRIRQPQRISAPPMQQGSYVSPVVGRVEQPPNAVAVAGLHAPHHVDVAAPQALLIVRARDVPWGHRCVFKPTCTRQGGKGYLVNTLNPYDVYGTLNG